MTILGKQVSFDKVEIISPTLYIYQMQVGFLTVKDICVILGTSAIS